MTETLELSKRLAECAEWLDKKAKQSHFETAEMLEAWADDIRAVVIPEPQQ